MKAGELAEMIMRAPTRRLDDDVRVVTFSPGSVGGTPSVGVIQANPGFDWDNGTFQIVPASKLTQLTDVDVADIRESVNKGQSWHAFQSYKKQYERIKALEAEVAALRSAALTPKEAP